MTVYVSVPDKPPTLELLQTNSDPIDQVKHQFDSDHHSIELASQTEEDPRGKSMTESVKVKPLSLELPSHDIHPFDQVKQQFHSIPYSMVQKVHITKLIVHTNTINIGVHPDLPKCHTLMAS